VDTPLPGYDHYEVGRLRRLESRIFLRKTKNRSNVSVGATHPLFKIS
jgi:hypothetical protein